MDIMDQGEKAEQEKQSRTDGRRYDEDGDRNRQTAFKLPLSIFKETRKTPERIRALLFSPIMASGRRACG